MRVCVNTAGLFGVILENASTDDVQMSMSE